MSSSSLFSSFSSPPAAAGDALRFRHATAVAFLLLGLMGFLAGGAALRESVTFDEVAHIGAGVSYIQKLDMRFNEEHPPLAKVIAAFPLVLGGTHADYGHISWTNSTQFVPHAFMGEWIFGEWLLTRWNDPRRTLAWARLPMLLLMLGLGWTVFVYARKLGGDGGGLLALSAYVSSPTFIAFGPLVHTDVAVTLFCLLTLWQFADLWREPSRRTAVWFGLCLAGALLSKFSAGLLFVAFGALAVSTRLLPLPGLPQDKTELRAWRRLRWKWTQRGTALAAIVVYGFYFLFSLNQSTDALSLIGHSARWVPLRRLLMPPWLYLRGLMMFVATSSRPTFLVGHGYPHGVWFYYPVLLALKSPLGFLGLVALLLALALRLKVRPGRIPVIAEAEAWRWRTIWVSLLVFTAACMLSQLSISIRHFGVPIVLLIVMLAPLPRMIQCLGREGRSLARAAGTLAVLLAASSLVSVARVYPHFVPFFNALTWSHPVYWWASDSNVDWNQALPEVRDFADRRGLKALNLDYCAMSDPTVLVPQARVWDCQQPSPDDASQWVVVSSNMILDQHNCSWLMQYPSEMLGGGSMWAVHLPPAIPAAGTPGGPPPVYLRKTYLGMPQDPRLANINLFRHPEQFPKYCADAEEQMRRYFRR
ncbi:MAG: glycosyltransferase family 39 protein [Terriglobia bacterium]